MNFVKKVTILIITIILCLPPMGAFAATVPKLDTTDVMDDLKGLKIGGVEFDEADYPFDASGDATVIGIYEHGWSTEQYSIYAYIYNPRYGVDNYEYRYSASDILIAVNLSPDNYDTESKFKYDSLMYTLIDVSADGRFLKVRIDGDPFVSVFALSDIRIYNVTGCIYRYSLRDDGSYYRSIFLVNSKSRYTFTGSAAYYSASETINLTVNPSMYKTDFSPKGDYWHQMIYTAYFTIPKEYVEKYDYLTRLEVTYEEIMTAPIVGVVDDDLFTILDAMASDSELDKGGPLGLIDYDYGAIVSEYYHTNGSVSAGYDAGFDFVDSINAVGKNGIRDDVFPYAKLKASHGIKHWYFDTVVKVDDLNDFYIPAIGRYYDTDGDGIGDTPATFQPLVDLLGHSWGQKTHVFTSEDILSVDKRFDDNWIRSFFNSILYPDSNDVEATLEPFYYLKDSDMAGYSRNKINHNLFIGEEFWDDFYDTYTAAKLKGDQVVLFRFALRDYYSAPARYITGQAPYTGYSNVANCALSCGVAFLDFDIIKLSFTKDAEIYEFNVDADPIDFVPGGYSPNTPGAGVGDGLHDILDAIYSAVKVVCVVVAIIVVVVVLDKTTAIFDRLFGRRRH